MTKANKFNPGRFEVELEGKTVVLKPTVKAYATLCTKYMTLSMVQNLCSGFNIVAMADVIVAACDDIPDEKTEDVMEAIFQGHSHTFSETTSRYVASLIYGGMEPTGEEKDSDDPKKR